MTFRPVGHRDRRPGHVASSCYAPFQSYRPGQCCGNKDQNPRDRGDTSATLWPRSVICLTASDLIPSGVSLLTHGTSYWASGMRLRGVYKMRAFTPSTVAGPRSPQAQTLNDCLERGAKTHGNVGRQHFGPAISAEVREIDMANAAHVDDCKEAASGSLASCGPKAGIALRSDSFERRIAATTRRSSRTSSATSPPSRPNVAGSPTSHASASPRGSATWRRFRMLVAVRW